MAEHPHFLPPSNWRIYTAEDIHKQQIGEESERRARLVLSDLHSLIKDILPSSGRDNSTGIDFWVQFYNLGHPSRPLQVKSSDFLVARFLQSNHYAEILLDHGPIIVLNAGRRVTDIDIKNSFLSQLMTIDGFV